MFTASRVHHSSLSLQSLAFSLQPSAFAQNGQQRKTSVQNFTPFRGNRGRAKFPPTAICCGEDHGGGWQQIGSHAKRLLRFSVIAMLSIQFFRRPHIGVVADGNRRRLCETSVDLTTTATGLFRARCCVRGSRRGLATNHTKQKVRSRCARPGSIVRRGRGPDRQLTNRPHGLHAYRAIGAVDNLR
jgi:hypothetical protein